MQALTALWWGDYQAAIPSRLRPAIALACRCAALRHSNRAACVRWRCRQVRSAPSPGAKASANMGPAACGSCQQSCPIFHVASGKVEGNDSVGLSGLSQTLPIGFQLRTSRLRQRSGWLRLTAS